jgi:adenylate cyclase
MPYVGLAYAHFFTGRHEQAALAANRAAQVNPQFTVPWALRTASLANLGRNEEFRASVQRLLELWPGVTIKRCLAGNFTSAERLAMLGEALRRAGIPDEW